MDLQRNRRLSSSPSPMMLRQWRWSSSLPSQPSRRSLSTSCSSSAASTAATRAALAVRFAEREGEKAESKLREGESIEMGDKKEGGERDALPAGVGEN